MRVSPAMCRASLVSLGSKVLLSSDLPLVRQLADGLLQIVAHKAHPRLVPLQRSIVARPADPQPNRARPREPAAFRQRALRSVQMTGKDWNVGPREQGPHAGFERFAAPVAGARSLWVQDQNVPLRCEQSAA